MSRHRHSIVGDTTRRAEQVIQQASANPWVERLARFGYVAKGIVYIIIGVLALLTAFGRGGETTDSRGALERIVTQPFGQILLGAVAVGLVGYALWRFVQAGADPEGKGTGFKGVAVRLGYAFSGVLHAGLAFTAVQLVLSAGNDRRGRGDATQDWTARALSLPLGRWLIVIAGLGIIGFGIFQLGKAYTAKFRKKLRLNEMSNTEQTWATRGGRLGFAARGIVFGVIGVFLVQAALRYDPSRAQGVGGALDALARQSYGSIILGVVALGLIAYGLFMFVEARYRRLT